ncbi:MAG: hypothetical protein H7Y31_06140 [Chitinophagaceae bacterium]|nr:hypothetical protein [Chitinophagaceae bacterium]
MPIEIKELHIKAVISDEKKTEVTGTVSAEEITKIRKELTKEITEKVIRILHQKNER